MKAGTELEVPTSTVEDAAVVEADVEEEIAVEVTWSDMGTVNSRQIDDWPGTGGGSHDVVRAMPS